MNKRSHRIINLCVVSLLLAALMNLSIVAAAPTSKTTPIRFNTAADDEQPTAKGLDPDGVPFVLRSDGTKARYVQIKPTIVKIQLNKNGINNGSVEFRSLAGREFSAKYTPSKGKIFSAVTKVLAVSKNAKLLARLTLEYGKDKVVLEGDDQFSSQDVPPETAKLLETFSEKLRADTNLRSLFSTTRFFVKKSTLESALPFMADSSCGWAAASCLVSLVEYGLGWALIIEVCGLTAGAGCIAALLFHPAAAALVAKHCADAVDACGLAN
jgi:hypothetical protein